MANYADEHDRTKLIYYRNFDTCSRGLTGGQGPIYFRAIDPLSYERALAARLDIFVRGVLR